MQANAEQFELPHPNGTSTLKISVSPRDDLPAGATDVPVLFVLDADTTFGLAAEIARFQGVSGARPTAMVVGIGYGAAFAEMAKLRTADFTLPSKTADAAAPGLSGLIGTQRGGAQAFLGFLVETLVPEILRRYPQASATEHMLFGHSLGGLFTAYALLEKPDAFSAFAVCSPALWWDGFAVLDKLDGLHTRLASLARPPRVLVGVGGQEQDLPTAVPAGMDMRLADIQAMVVQCRMIDAAAEFAASLRQAGLPDVGYVCFDGEDHTSVSPAMLSRALRFAVA